MADDTHEEPGDPNFCDTYTPVEDIEELIATSDEAFFRRYRFWDDSDRPGGSDILTVFGDPGTIVAAFGSRHIRKEDCPKFNDFLATVGSEEQLSLDEVSQAGGQLEQRSNSALTLFDAAVLKLFVLKTPLRAYETAALNGALIVQMNLDTTSIGSGASRRTFGMPASAITPWARDTNAGLWKVVDDIIEDAFKVTATRMINVTGVVQVRLGGATGSLFGPVDVAPGFTIRGGV